MIELPDFLKHYQALAESYLAKHLLKEIEFSNGTYQLLVKDPKSKEELWAFLQIDDWGQIQDSFCQCQENLEGHGCSHVAAAYLRIFNDENVPLHIRYEKSLWSKLCRICADNLGYGTNIIKKGTLDSYQIKKGNEIIFSISGKSKTGKAKLKGLIDQRVPETEQTSLKFSNLSEEEIELWRNGRPSPQLSYELSFWADLAKWLTLLQDETQNYKVTFPDASELPPHQISIEFEEIKLFFYLEWDDFSEIIPYLTTVKSELPVHTSWEGSIDAIQYDPKKGLFHLIKSEDSKNTKNQSHSFDQQIIEQSPLKGWIYVQNKGFYASSTEFLGGNIDTHEISKVLTDNPKLIQAKLKNAIVYYDVAAKALSYKVYFDHEWNLHVKSYLFNEGDLTSGYSRNFDNWVYIDSDTADHSENIDVEKVPSGFYKLAHREFEQLNFIVPEQEVSHFVSRYRIWINMQPGFQTHLASLKTGIMYSVTSKGFLHFQGTSIDESADHCHDFGGWFYVEDQGFYVKATGPSALSIHSDMVLQPEQIPAFIREHREELKIIPNFFSQVNPIENLGLNIKVGPKDVIIIEPQYTLIPEYQNKELIYYQDVVYIVGEGFYELPQQMLIPYRFYEKIEIPTTEQTEFFLEEWSTLQPYIASIDPRLYFPKELILELKSADLIDTESLQEEYALKFNYKSEQGQVEVTSIWKAIKKNKRFMISDAGVLDLEQHRFNWIRYLRKESVNLPKHQLILSSLELLRLNAFEKLTIKEGNTQGIINANRFLKELQERNLPPLPNISGLNSHLRPYQEMGVQWLWFLYCHKLSGLLCDDMGLGKTHQAMALLAAVTNELHKKNENVSADSNIESKSKKRPLFLIVCPTSVIYHWQEKLNAFFPSMRIFIFHGLKRNLSHFTDHYDLLLTSYGIWRREYEILRKIPFEVAIFDEVQIAKNDSSKLHNTLLKLRARMKIGLTGTPIENRLRELKSLFDVVLPTYMPSDADFSRFFVTPIEKGKDVQRQQLLTRFIKPFILRRRKEQVLFDLPEKTEEISHCDLHPEQHKLYNEILHQARPKLMKDLEDEKKNIPYMHIFALLSNLKQICNHPAAFLKTPKEFHKHHSGKWNLFLELLHEARDSGQKIVVFSQYLAMLDIIILYLQEKGIGFATIRGSTTNRAEQIRKFNQDPSCEVFVASLQASGLGIDLTAASVVIHYDRWWNAARENQATDRVHRIGQTRGVQVFKLVTKRTFEERIDALIEKKGQLMEATVGVDDHTMLKQFDRSDLMALLQDIESVKLGENEEGSVAEISLIEMDDEE